MSAPLTHILRSWGFTPWEAHYGRETCSDINKTNFYKCHLQLDYIRCFIGGGAGCGESMWLFLLLGINWSAIASTLVGNPHCTLTKAIETQRIRERRSNGLLIASQRSGRAAAVPAHLMNSIRTKLQLNNFNREQPVKSDRHHFNL